MKQTVMDQENKGQAELTYGEVVVIHMALKSMIEDIGITMASKEFNQFTIEAKKQAMDMYENAKSAAAKIAKSSGLDDVPLPEFKPGDEKEFMTQIVKPGK